MNFATRAMTPADLDLVIGWAASEGWNPGLHDAACFRTVDPDGFIVGELDGEPIASISAVNYDARFSFLGLYIVRPDLRGRGYGRRTWNAAMAHGGARRAPIASWVWRRCRSIAWRPTIVSRSRRRAPAFCAPGRRSRDMPRWV